ncbi:MAG: thioredoxin family protein, partial [Legionella sp. 21-45-4]
DYPDDSPEKMQEIAAAHHYPFPYLFDETQEVAKAYKATCTPDFFVFDNALQLVYRGQLDDSRPGNTLPSDGHCIRNALESLLNNQPVSDIQKPSVGCNIKWKKD